MPVILKASASCYLLFQLYAAGTSWRSWLRHCATNRKVAGSIHDGATGILFDVEYIYGFVWWGVCKQSRWRHSVTEPSEDSGYVLLRQRYDNNKMVAMRYYGNVSFCCWRCVYWACYRCILHLQQYSHRLNLFSLCFFFKIQSTRCGWKEYFLWYPGRPAYNVGTTLTEISLMTFF